MRPTIDHSHEAADGAVHPPGNIEVMPEKEVLDFKPAPRPELVGDNRHKQQEDRKYRAG
jgi:hypothetical protein